ncbi:DMT family transporter [Limobrevibacterium gyesilva]|uniref:DMT family transporter n=1 Tax=Limobrevibacterium gyesilva TaxID=2991712 RepID=A0AA41YPW0_9PROT|nr:DMT family transporter [Limobrevibacterium gyesilva]MCW3476700.1 DMT family transporter [Limobrevibacterium gyesilva]
MLARLAPLIFVLLWSSSFIAAKTGLRYLSPLLFVAIRLAACAIALVALMLVLRRSWQPIAGRQGLHCAVAGALLNAVGLMAPHVGLLMAPAAQIALVQSLTPLLTAAFGLVLLRERLRTGQWLGLALGLAGVGLVVGQAALESATRFQGLVLAFVGVIGLVAGTLYFGRFCRGVPLLPSATAQFLSASVVAALGAWLLEAPRADWTGGAIASIAWNTVMVSMGGMGLYFAMLARGTAARTTANFYLVPGTAALLAWGLLGERLSPLAVAGLVVASAGCWLVNAVPRAGGRAAG